MKIEWLGLTEAEVDLIYSAAVLGSAVKSPEYHALREAWQGIVRTIDQMRAGDWTYEEANR